MTNCNDCKNKFIDNLELRKHKGMEHGVQAMCPVCSRVTRKKDTLKIEWRFMPKKLTNVRF